MSDEQGHISKQRRIQLLVGLVAIIAVAILVLMPRRRPVPDASEISGMRAQVYKSNADFNVPREHWESILAALKPSDIDPSPEGRQTLASLSFEDPHRGPS